MTTIIYVHVLAFLSMPLPVSVLLIHYVLRQELASKAVRQKPA